MHLDSYKKSGVEFILGSARFIRSEDILWPNDPRRAAPRQPDAALFLRLAQTR